MLHASKNDTTKQKLPSLIALWAIPIIFSYILIFKFLFSASALSAIQNINEAVSDGSTSNQVLWVLVFLSLVFALIKLGFSDKENISKHIFFIFFLLLYAIISCSWSEVPLISLRRSLQQFIIVFCLITPFAIGVDSKRVLILISFVFSLFLIINVSLIPLLGLDSFGYRGITPQKNILGQISALAFFFSCYMALVEEKSTKWFFVSMSILALLLCLVSNSKTSLALICISPIFASVFVGISSLSNTLIKAFWSLAVVIAVYIFFSASILIPFDIYYISELIYHDRTFTGRTDIWEFAGYYIDQSPLIGYGYGSFWGVGDSSRAIGEGFIGGLLQAHNGFVDIVLELGYLGLLNVSIIIFLVISRLLKLPSTEVKFKMLLMTCIVFILMNNSMESSLFRGYASLSVTFILCTGLLFNSKRIG